MHNIKYGKLFSIRGRKTPAHAETQSFTQQKCKAQVAKTLNEIHRNVVAVDIVMKCTNATMVNWLHLITFMVFL